MTAPRDPSGALASSTVWPSYDDPVARTASESIGGPVGDHARPHPWWTPVRVVLAVTCIAWALAMVQKSPCAKGGWSGDETRYAQLCYSDLPYLYVYRGFAELELPYTDSGGRYQDLEYPVLTGYFVYGAAVATQALHGWPDLSARHDVVADAVAGLPGVEQERRDFFLVNALLLVPFVLLTAFFLSGAHPRRPWDAMGFAAAPMLVLTGLVNWDLIAVACVAGAFWAHARGRPVLTGLFIGIGAAAKLYPIFLIGAFLVVAVRQRRLPTFGATAAAAAGAWLGCNLPAMLTNFEAWQGFWKFNSARGTDLGSLWLLAQLRGHAVNVETLNRVSLLLFLVGCVAVAVLGLAAKRTPRVAQLAFLVLVAFLLVNKVYSPQYVLWLLPLAVLARPRWRDLLIWQAGEAFYFVMVWLYLGQFTSSSVTGGVDPAYSAAIVVRVVAELYLAAVVVRDILWPWHDPVGQSNTI